MPWAPIVSWTPAFLLKLYVLSGIRGGPHEPFIADSVDFVVSQVETLSKDDLASRLTLTVDAASVGPLVLSDSFTTIMDTSDYCAISQQLKDQVSERYPGARRAYLKSGGDFPFLSRPDEVNLHLQLHLRRIGVEARPDLIQGLPKDGGGERSREQDDESKDADDETKDDKMDSAGPSTESGPPLLPESSDSRDLDNQLLSSTNVFVASGKFQRPIALLVFREKYIFLSNAFIHLMCENLILNLLPLYLRQCSLAFSITGNLGSSCT